MQEHGASQEQVKFMSKFLKHNPQRSQIREFVRYLYESTPPKVLTNFLCSISLVSDACVDMIGVVCVSVHIDCSGNMFYIVMMDHLHVCLYELHSN